MEPMLAPRGVIFDYGGTIDSRGVHWSWIIWQAYQDEAVPVTLEQFRDAYVHGERELARVRHILPQDDFRAVLFKKMRIELQCLVDNGVLAHDVIAGDRLAARLADCCDASARECVEEARPVLEAIAERVPMMLVSNFYGNIDSVLAAYDLRRYFRGIIESAVVGVRKPNPTIFRLGVDALEMSPADVLVVGDSMRKDIEPAQSLGCSTVWVKGRGWTPDEDGMTHPHTIGRLPELLPLLAQ